MGNSKKMYIVRHWFKIEETADTIEKAKKYAEQLKNMGDNRKDIEILELEQTFKKVNIK